MGERSGGGGAGGGGVGGGVVGVGGDAEGGAALRVGGLGAAGGCLGELSAGGFPRGGVRSLALRCDLGATVDGQEGALRFPKLLELDLSGCARGEPPFCMLWREGLQAVLDSTAF